MPNAAMNVMQKVLLLIMLSGSRAVEKGDPPSDEGRAGSSSSSSCSSSSSSSSSSAGLPPPRWTSLELQPPGLIPGPTSTQDQAALQQSCQATAQVVLAQLAGLLEAPTISVEAAHDALLAAHGALLAAHDALHCLAPPEPVIADPVQPLALSVRQPVIADPVQHTSEKENAVHSEVVSPHPFCPPASERAPMPQETKILWLN